jgi:carbonic anhydrase
MVLGHTSCGAVNATVTALQQGNTLPGHIADLVRAMKPGIEPALAQAGDDLTQRALVRRFHETDLLWRIPSVAPHVVS